MSQWVRLPHGKDIVSQPHRLELGGESMRKVMAETEKRSEEREEKKEF